MLFSEVFPMKLKGEDVQLRVCRNDGFCWGRIVKRDGTNLDVVTGRDYYEQDDSEAADEFKRAAARGKIEPSCGWELVWDE